MQTHTIEFIASEDAHGERIDKWLNRALSQFLRKQIQEAIENGSIKVNNQSTNQKYILAHNDEIAGFIEVPSSNEILAQNIPLDVIYEDEHLIVINKPAGIVTHPGHGNPDNTLLNGLLHHCPSNKILPKL